MIRARNYYSAFYDCEYQHQWLLPALLRLVSLRFKYEYVEFEFRQ